MKKIILTLLLLLPALLLRADERGEAVLRKMAAAFQSYTSYRVDFTATMGGEFAGLPGELIVSGSNYYLDVYDSEIFFDGTTGYTYSESNNEVILETPDPDDYRLFANPTRIFQLYEQDYSATFRGRAPLNEKTVDEVGLTPRASRSGLGNLTLYTDPTSGMPVRMVYRLEEYGADLVLDIQQITPNITLDAKTFSFDPEQYPDVEVIDFR
ncbi:MAG: outer membrane lipoprotein carrier protein LolA [Rikenellaceae bacterium]|jgi:outer membrane lipoprotein-sorting protein|nr:outer membrane lipoprotein carrier protein LolA [Rikenellaceae bacterium]